MTARTEAPFARPTYDFSPEKGRELREKSVGIKHLGIVVLDPAFSWGDKQNLQKIKGISDAVFSRGIPCVVINFPSPASPVSPSFLEELRNDAEQNGKEFGFAGEGLSASMPNVLTFEKPTLIVKAGLDGKSEVIRAIKTTVTSGTPEDKIDEDTILNNLDVPIEMDAVIAIGVKRDGAVPLLGYFAYQLAYAEIASIEKSWEEITTSDVETAIGNILERDERNFGGLANRTNGKKGK